MKPQQQELFTLQDIRNLATKDAFLVARDDFKTAVTRLRSNGDWAVWQGLQFQANFDGEITIKTESFCALVNVSRATFFRAISACIDAKLLDRTPTGYRLIRSAASLTDETQRHRSSLTDETIAVNKPVESLTGETESRPLDCSFKNNTKSKSNTKKLHRRSAEGSLFDEPTEPEIPEPVKSLWRAIIDEIDSGYRKLNGDKPGWDGRAFKLLQKTICIYKHWDLAKWQTCIRNRYASDINPADPPHLFIPNLVRYASGPLNEYYRPKNGANSNGNGNGHRPVTFDQARTENNNRAYHEACEIIIRRNNRETDQDNNDAASDSGGDRR
jgi:hypothetical protein